MVSEILVLTPQEAVRIHASEKMLRLVGKRKDWRKVYPTREYEVLGLRKNSHKTHDAKAVEKTVR